MRAKLLAPVVAALALVAATPAEVVPSLETNGFYLEDTSDADHAAISDAVAEARRSSP